MAALVTLADAKRHLRIDTSTEDSDVQLKLEQASDIILSYLKGRALSVSTVTSSGGVATVTTVTPHGLATNGTAVVIGAEQPEYNGLVTVTVTSTTTFTYAITGTPVTTATGTIRINATETWTTSTVPVRVQAAVLLMLGRLYEQRGDEEKADAECWAAIERILVRDRDPALA